MSYLYDEQHKNNLASKLLSVPFMSLYTINKYMLFFMNNLKDKNLLVFQCGINYKEKINKAETVLKLQQLNSQIHLFF